MSRGQDFLAICRGLQMIAQEGILLQRNTAKFVYENSSLRVLLQNCVDDAIQNSGRYKNANISETVSDGIDRLSTVLHGIRQYASVAYEKDVASFVNIQQNVNPEQTKITELQQKFDPNKNPAVNKATARPIPDYKIRLSASDREILERLDMEHSEKMRRREMELQEKHENAQTVDNKKIDEVKKSAQKKENNIKEKQHEVQCEEKAKGDVVNMNLKTESQKKEKVKAVPNIKRTQSLSSHSKQRTVPSSRIGRMISFGSLAAGLGIGTAAEYARRTLGMGDRVDASTLFMTPSNLDRIVDTLCKVRGAALKLGQIMSIQDESVVSPELARALERVRKSADFMPNWQVEKVLSSELGANWKDQFSYFEEKPFAAASIGQVHAGKTTSGRNVAIKIQYPGVAKGIESDIDNVCGILSLWNIFPRGMFLDNLMKVAKRELAWEVDYTREAECTRKFKKLLEPYPDFYVPDVIDNLSTKQVFTTEMLEGIPVDQCFDMSLEDRQFIGEKIMELTLLEILEFRYMQTDPNWANFLYDPIKKKILLLDFGASREYSKSFMDKYVRILKAACDKDTQTVLEVSREIGFLTGYENKLMEEAHVDAVMILGEVFQCPGEYPFGNQDMTLRINNLVPTMLTHRLCPPPEEVYSLHRKLSGVFLLCSKLNISVACRNMFLKYYNRYINQ